MPHYRNKPRRGLGEVEVLAGPRIYINVVLVVFVTAAPLRVVFVSAVVAFEKSTTAPSVRDFFVNVLDQCLFAPQLDLFLIHFYLIL